VRFASFRCCGSAKHTGVLCPRLNRNAEKRGACCCPLANPAFGRRFDWFLFAQVSAAPYLNGNWDSTRRTDQLPFFISAEHNLCANRKIERPKSFS
jgi:hypothetical protein